MDSQSPLTRLNEDVLLCIIEVLCLASRWDDLKAFSLTCRAIRLVMWYISRLPTGAKAQRRNSRGGAR
ncbi:hypothetical protein VTO73DRAFT_14359 [Trametes versicolor]